MNEQDRLELQSLKERQNELLRQLGALAERLQTRENVLEHTQRELRQIRETQASLETARRTLQREITNFETRVISSSAQESASQVSTGTARSVTPIPADQPSHSHAKPPPLPLNIPPVIPTPSPAPSEPAFVHPSASGSPVQAQRPVPAQPIPQFANQAQTPSTPPVIPAREIVREPEPAPKGSFELRLGTYWFVRIGIVMLLTGVVFLGTYAYKNFIGTFGAGGKVTLLYLLSAALLGIGSWLYRKQETLKNYAQVLFAGGLAAVYFTTYAAHHIPTLQIIRSAAVDGVLLLGWAGFVVWLADRRKSEILALFAVGLAFYSSVMTQVGLFTLYSNLILTIAAIFFLVKNRWAALTFATLTASYGGYAFWRFFHGGEWHWAGPDDGLWKGCYFLISYWALFTVAVFSTKSEQFAGKKRSTFLSLNNTSFFTLFILTMLQVRLGGFWKFALLYGSVLLGLAALARWKLTSDKLARNAYVTQGLLLVTVGFITYFAGMKLALVLATESMLLVLANRHMQSRILQLGAYATGLMAVGWCGFNMAPMVRTDLLMGSFIGSAMIFNAAFSLPKEKREIPTILFTVLGLIVWFLTTWEQTGSQWRGLALAVESLAFVIASQPLRNFALRHGALPYAAAAIGWAVYTMDKTNRAGLYIGLGIGAVVLLNDLLASDEDEAGSSNDLRFLFPFGTLVIWLVTTAVYTPAAHLAPVVAAEGLLLVGSYRLLASRTLTFGGLIFIFLAQLACMINLMPKDAVSFAPAWSTIKLPWWNPVIVGLISLGVAHWSTRQKTILKSRQEAQAVQFAYVLPIAGILFFALHPHFSPGAWLAMTAALAVVVTIYGLVTRLWFLAGAAQIYVFYSVLQFLRLAVLGPASFKPTWYWALMPAAALVALSALAAQRRRISEKPEGEAWLDAVGLIYRAMAVTVSIGWVFRYVSEENFAWAFALLGAGCFFGLWLKRSRELLVISAVYSALAVVILWSWIGDDYLTNWPNLLVILGLLVQAAIAQRRTELAVVPKEASIGGAIVGLATLWLWTSKWISGQSGSFYLTATWAGLALVIFAAGFLLKDKVYRWSGLAVLASAIIRVGLVDIWRLGTIYRILSFMALGVVLLVVGLIYTKYQEKIRQWL